MSATIQRTAPALDYEPMHTVAAIVAEAATVYFRQVMVYNPRAPYDGYCATYADSITQSVRHAVVQAWRDCEEEADRIAGDALRQAFGTEVAS